MKISNKNSQNRHNRKIHHNTGSKGFSQTSFEKRDPLTGDEPNDMELFMMTHSNNGEWTSEESREVYDNANNKIMERESRPDATFISDVEQNQIFQTAYKETRRSKSYKMHANGYLARYPTRKELLSEEYQRKVQQDEALMDAFTKLQEILEAQDAEREAEREEHRRQIEQMKKEREADREALKQAMSMMQAAQQQPSVQQASTVGQQIQDVPAATNMAVHNVTTTEGEDMVDNQQDIQDSIPPQTQRPCSTPEGTTNMRISRRNSTSQNKGGNSNVAFTTTRQLRDNAAKKRAALSNRRNAQEEA